MGLAPHARAAPPRVGWHNGRRETSEKKSARSEMKAPLEDQMAVSTRSWRRLAWNDARREKKATLSLIQ